MLIFSKEFLSETTNFIKFDTWIKSRLRPRKTRLNPSLSALFYYMFGAVHLHVCASKLFSLVTVMSYHLFCKALLPVTRLFAYDCLLRYAIAVMTCDLKMLYTLSLMYS